MKFAAALIAALLLLPAAARAETTDKQAQVAAVRTEMTRAIEDAAKIINQPVTHLRFNPALTVPVFSPGWFHEGAIKPDFDTVDVRKTQEFPYEHNPYVTSDLNPTEMFMGRELEFNAMTKYFYADRGVPKKRLTEKEMLEVNRLYRVIGRCERDLARLQEKSGSAVEKFLGTPLGLASLLCAMALALFVTIAALRRKAG